MELGKKETLYQPLINEGGNEEVRLNPSDSESGPSNYIVADT